MQWSTKSSGDVTRFKSKRSATKDTGHHQLDGDHRQAWRREMRPTDEQQQAFLAATRGLFGGDSAARLSIRDVGVLPEADDHGHRRRVEGFGVSFQGVVEPGWSNHLGMMHGAAYCWLVDTCTSATLVALSTDTFWGAPNLSGVSVSMDVKYLHPAPVGSTVIVRCTVLKINLTLACVQCDIMDETERVLATGLHVKTWRPSRSKL